MLDNLLNVLSYLGWAFFGFLVIALTARGFQSGGVRGAVRMLTTGRVFLAFVVALAISLISTSLVFVEPQESAVVISLLSRGGYREQPLRSGLHWIVPLAEQVKPYPIYWQNYTMSTEPLEGDKVGDDSIAARTSDGQAVYIDASVIYRIDANEVIRVHIDLQNRYVEDFVRPVIRGIVRTEVSQFTADEVNSSKRKNLESNLEELLRQAFDEKGFILDRFLLRNISFSEEYATAIEQKQVAEQEQTQREYQAEQLRKMAAGRADAAVLEGQAEADVIRIKAEAEAEALRLIAAALAENKDLITYRYIDKLAPGIRVMLVPNDNPYLLPLPDLSGELIDGTSTMLPSLGLTDTLTTTLSLPTPGFPTPTPTPTLSP